MEERLQKILAQAGLCSRRKAEELISRGLVKIDGQVVTQLGTKIDPSCHRIECNGKLLPSAEKKIYLLLNKPTGYVTTLHDPQGRPVVSDLIRDIGERLFPVGRLDQDTEGALILTNDGDFAQRILHPSYEIKRTYLATVEGHPSKTNLAALRTGVIIDGRKTWPAELHTSRHNATSTTIRITIHEGRKRQVRRMFETIGHPVISLCRIAYGALELGTLPRGRYRILSREDLKLLFSDKNPLDFS